MYVYTPYLVLVSVHMFPRNDNIYLYSQLYE